MSVLTESEPALAYDSLAPFYDQFTLGYAHEAWIAAIERRALELGLEGTRALDLACGTGKSTLPLVARGYDVLSCDVSPEMIREARRKCPERADCFVVADMRRLPPLGTFDLVLCVDDAVNYLLSGDELADMFARVAESLAPGGIFVFDVNTLATFREAFGQAVVQRAGWPSVRLARRSRRLARDPVRPPPRVWRSSLSATTGFGNGGRATMFSAITRRR